MKVATIIYYGYFRPVDWPYWNLFCWVPHQRPVARLQEFPPSFPPAANHVHQEAFVLLAEFNLLQFGAQTIIRPLPDLGGLKVSVCRLLAGGASSPNAARAEDRETNT
jgi:hypothetical protein